ncbi:hypothetical protein F4778DRAFT_131220 [Xylariomycetidae sp. FL2044]|nr:hypothetical protein F4778DRAFT_131220 [Xylariomycetidae sp. FL2044]
MFGKADGFSGFSNIGDGDEWSRNGNWSTNSTGLSQASSEGNSTFGVINEFKFLAARSIRTSTIILAAFNTISAFATAAGIYFDAYMRAKRSNTGGKQKINIFTCVGGPETFPFILSLGITIQGIIFAVSQAHGLDGLFKAGCSLVSQFMWPAIFIVPYIQLVFGLEVAFRALRTRPFPPRGKWDVAICLAVIKILLLITGLVAFFVPAPNFCFASLFWFVAKWAEGGFVLLLMIAVVLTICATVVFLKLTRYSMIENSQRIGASRMVYYMATGVVTNSLMVPFFIYLTLSSPFDDDNGPGLTLSMIATVVANVTGLMTGGLHLFLRSNTIATIGPKDKTAEYERQKFKQQIKVRGPSEMDFHDHMLQPVSGPRSLRKAESQESLVSSDRGDTTLRESNIPAGEWAQSGPTNPNPLRSNAVYQATTPKAPEPAQVANSLHPTSHGRKPSASYTLFPNRAQNNNTTSVALLPSTTYAPNANTTPFADFGMLRPPPSIPANGFRHRRDSSMASSATVQIGLRLSNVEDMPPMASRVVTEAERTNAFDWPEKTNPAPAHRPSPLANASSADSVASASRPQSPERIGDTLARERSPSLLAHEHDEQKECILCPKVYDPNSPTKSKVPSPRGVGFQLPQRANTTPVQGNDAPASPHVRSNSSAPGNKNGWI